MKSLMKQDNHALPNPHPVMIKYMHTLDEKPAYFCSEEGQIFFANRTSYSAVRLVDSVKQIHLNERISAKTRKKEYGENVPGWSRGWVKVMVP